MGRSSGIGLVYVIIGLVIASTHGYLANLGIISNLVSALLAILLWPLVLFGVHIQIAF